MHEAKSFGVGSCVNMGFSYMEKRSRILTEPLKSNANISLLDTIENIIRKIIKTISFVTNENKATAYEDVVFWLGWLVVG